MSSTSDSEYTLHEEMVHSITHGIGIVLSVIGLTVLIVLTASRGTAWHVVSTTVFGATLVLLYTSSTLYHGFREEKAKDLMQKLDHAAIYALIAGTYTPFLLVNLRGPWGWSLFGVIWGLAVVGMVLSFWFAGRFRLVTTLVYLGMGWLMVVAIRPLLASVAPSGLWLLLAGGLCYSGGTIFYLWRAMRYHHAVWHGFVLAGSICHFFAVLYAVVPAAA
ncbi:MAG: hemolysin III family protein [Opitutae bacterium]|nr:hemolysin III family protein [Opitutae bacterium]